MVNIESQEKSDYLQLDEVNNLKKELAGYAAKKIKITSFYSK